MKNQSNQKAYFKHVLAVDCETTGLTFGSDDPSDGHQAVSWGLVVADSQSFEPIEELYVEVQWNPVSIQSRKKDPKFGTYAEKIHGLSQSYLKKNGVPELEAVSQIANLILKYWGPTNAISTLGHNVATFDMPFLRAMFHRHNVDMRFANRHMDSFSLGVGTVGAFDSNNLFETMGNSDRTDHNALDDCKMALDAFHLVKKLWTVKVGLET
jgi:DNA polymerase III epsilon subunit-like protein